jgi:hypothetical protein
LVANEIIDKGVPANPGAGVGLRLVTALTRALPGAVYRSHHGTRWHAALLILPEARNIEGQEILPHD